MESLSGPRKVTFELLRTRLLQQIKLRINSGEFTERGLARILGISQSQTHNVLKGARRLQMHLADRILFKLGLSAADLLSEAELNEGLRSKMSEWDLLELLDAAEQVTPKKPAGVSGVATTNTAQEDRQTG